MLRFASAMYNLGAKAGRQITPDMLTFNRRSVKSAAMKLASERMAQFKPIIQKSAENGEICFALDHGQRIYNYLSVVAHLVVEEENGWKMYSRPVGFIRVKEDEKDAESIYNQFCDLCRELGINPYHIQYCSAVSDEGSPIVKALKYKFFTDIRCICHLLCTVVSHIFVPYKKNSILNASEKAEIQSCNDILSCGKTVISLARCSKNLKFNTKPRQFVATRFMSCLWVLEDLLKNFDEIVQKSHDTRALKAEEARAICLVAANKRKIEFLVALLKPIEEAITTFEGERYPTLHKVPIFWSKLQKKADELLLSNDNFEKSIGKALQEALERKDKNITGCHYAATMLYPPTRKMLKFTDEQKSKAQLVLKEVCESVEYVPKSSTNTSLVMDDMHDSEALSDDTFENELIRYQTSPEVFQEKDDLLNWWAKRKESYPRLSLAAKKILSIPASSTSPERSFSHSKNVITDKRFNLSEDSVSGIMLGGYY